MPRKKRSFIDKKKAVKFQVVHRSQRDPLASDNDATKFVLQPVLDPKQASRRQADILSTVPKELLQMLEEDEDGMLEMETDEEEDDFSGDEEGAYAEEGDEEFGEMKLDEEDVAAAGGDSTSQVLLPGEYDYSKHLKTIGGSGGKFVQAPNGSDAAALRAQTQEVKDESVFFGGIELDKTLFASDKEDRVGLLMRGVADAPRFNLPNDVKKVLELVDEGEDDGLEDEFDELEDNFVALAMGLEAPEGENLEELEEKEREREAEMARRQAEAAADRPALRLEELLDAEDDADLEQRKMRMLDEHFERLMTQYADEEIGELEEDDPRVRGTETLDEHKAALDAYLEKGRSQFYQPNKPEFEDDQQDVIKRRTAVRLAEIEKVEGTKDIEQVDKEIDDSFKPKERSQWDCESIVSTYSTTSNIPRIIKEPRLSSKPKIQLSKKLGIPLGVLPERGAGARDENEEEEEEEEWEEPVNQGERRPKNETKEEKAARKKAQKEAKRLRRAQKKATKQLYRAENNAEARRVNADRAAAQGATRM